MEWKTLSVLIFCYFAYLLIGAAVFWSLEYEDNIDLCREASEFFDRINHTIDNSTLLQEIIEKSYRYRQAGVYFLDGQVVCKETWDYLSCVFFAGTIITTIGYGHLVPTNRASKSFCVVFALIGIPIFTIMFGAIGDLFGDYMKRFMAYLDKRVESRGGAEASPMKDRRRRTRTHAWTLLAVFGTSGFLLFCLVPALLFRLVEQWSFSDSLYFTIVTLTTIGFGDFVPGSEPGTHYVPLYRVMVYLWILFGLAYTATFLKFISTYLIRRTEEIFSSKRSKANGNHAYPASTNNKQHSAAEAAIAAASSSSSASDLQPRSDDGGDAGREMPRAEATRSKSFICNEVATLVDSSDVIRTDATMVMVVDVDDRTMTGVSIA